VIGFGPPAVPPAAGLPEPEQPNANAFAFPARCCRLHAPGGVVHGGADHRPGRDGLPITNAAIDDSNRLGGAVPRGADSERPDGRHQALDVGRAPFRGIHKLWGRRGSTLSFAIGSRVGTTKPSIGPKNPVPACSIDYSPLEIQVTFRTIGRIRRVSQLTERPFSAPRQPLSLTTASRTSRSEPSAKSSRLRKLQRHRTAQARVEGTVDLSHTACAQNSFNSIGSCGCAGGAALVPSTRVRAVSPLHPWSGRADRP
jgi:hypothetical protein